MTTDLFFRDPYNLDFLNLIAIILCASKNDTMAELLELDTSGIHVAQYLTKYVPKELLEQKFIDSIESAKIQLEQREKLEK